MIKKRLAAVAAKRTSTSTHGGNEDKLNVGDSDQTLLNHMSADTLVDPEDQTPGSTHTSITASVEEGEEQEEALEEDLEEDDTIEASFDTEEPDELENSNAVTPITAEDAADDWDAPPPSDEEDIEDDEETDTEVEADSYEDEEDDADEEVTVNDSESLDLVDIDDMPDTDVNVAFASLGTKLMVIKANRIIATMNKRVAEASGRADVYLSDQFQEVTAAELATKGLRKGLKTMGFALAKVNVAKSAVVNARVAKEVTKTTAAVRKVTASKEEAFSQSLTIAAVGINRRYFDQPNELKAYLETEMQRAGIKGASKMLQRAFASYGPAYAKSIVELATKISAMPKESRDGFVTALDLTTEDLDDMPEDGSVPIGADTDGAEFDETEFDDDTPTDTVTASIASPGYKRPVVASASNYSLTAAAILKGEQPLF